MKTPTANAIPASRRFRVMQNFQAQIVGKQLLGNLLCNEQRHSCRPQFVSIGRQIGRNYKVVNVVRGDKTADEEASQSDVERVNRAMDPDPATTKTITLTVRKMTTGVTIKPWTGVLFMSNTNSAMQ